MRRPILAEWLPCRLWSVVLLAACTNDAPVAKVEIYSWWVSGAEQSALNAVLKDFATKNATLSVTNAAAQNALSAQHELQNRIAEGNPPDTFQVNGGAELRQYVEGASPSPLEPLDFLATQQNWGVGGVDGGPQLMPPQIVGAVTFRGHIYAVPVDIARINTLFYNKQIFRDNGLEPPATMADFVRVANVLQANHVTPVAIGAQVPWTLEVIFKGCLAATGGPGYYTQFSSGRNSYFAGSPGAPVDATFNMAVACFATVLSAANRADMRSLTWDQAVQEVREKTAAMTIMGDWALGEFLRLGAVADVDFGEIPAPDSAGTFIFTTDTFVLPRGAKNRAGAIALLNEWGSAEGQSAFYPLKGTIATRSDAAPNGYDSISKATMADFKNPQIQIVPDWALAMPQAFTTNFDVALDRFAYDGNAENVVLAAKNNYDSVVAGHWP
jgi:glucose/mannose transport system substrate-binding protein